MYFVQRTGIMLVNHFYQKIAGERVSVLLIGQKE